MSRKTTRLEWVNRYVRDELTVDEMAEFEHTLMDSPAMQQDLETVLGLREALLLEPEQHVPRDELLPESLAGGGNWKSMALAATVILAVFSTVMFWKVSNESAHLQRQLDVLSQPRSNVLRVPVNIMRSAGARTPDVIAQKPAGHSAILLDIQLAPRSLQQPSLVFSLVDEAGTTVLSWSATSFANGRAEALLNSEQVPGMRLWLEIASDDGELLERRLLEFR